MVRLVFIAFCLLLVLSVAGQESDSSQNSVLGMHASQRHLGTPVPSCSELKTTLPFTMAGRLILIQCRIDTLEGYFILDTGAPHLVLNKSWFRQYGQTTVAKAGGVTGAIEQVLQTSVSMLSFGGISYQHIEADVIELSHIEKSRGVPILGLLGLSLFRSFELQIDYDKQSVHLYQLDRKGKRLEISASSQEPALRLPIDLYNNMILLDGSLNGVPMRYCIDTGAELNLLHNRLPKKAMQSIEITGRALLSGTGEKKIEVLKGIAREVEFGKKQFEPMPVLLTHLGHMSLAQDLRIDGLLGFDFLSPQTTSFNFVSKELIFWKNTEGKHE